MQSEEGGRFFQNENSYRVIQVEGEVAIEDNQVWVSVREIKSLLTSSDLTSIQLRCIASMVLDLLNPESGLV